MKTFTKLFSYSLFLLLLFCTTKETMAQCADTTKIYSFQITGKNYELVKEKKTWVQAAACAVERGGYLVQIGSATENTAIYLALVASGIASNYNPISDGGGTSYVWIGGSDRVTEGNWIWDGTNSGSGTLFWKGQGTAGTGGGTAQGGAYINWGGSVGSNPKEPDDFGGSQDAAAMALDGWPAGTTMLGTAAEWNDVSETNTMYYVIEFGAASGFLQPDIKQEMGLFPNPAETETKLVLSSPVANGSVKIYDAKGNCLSRSELAETNSLRIPLEALSPGLYLVELCSKEGRLTQRLVRNLFREAVFSAPSPY